MTQNDGMARGTGDLNVPRAVPTQKNRNDFQSKS